MLQYFISLFILAFTFNALAIVNGKPASESQFKSVVALVSNDKVFCSGTLIAPDVVLTSAQCVDLKPPKLQVFAGTAFKAGEKNNLFPVDRAVTYAKDFKQANIALLKLKSSIYSTRPIILIANKNFLPNLEQMKSQTLVGFGMSSFTSGTPGTKNFGETPVIGFKENFILLSKFKDTRIVTPWSGDSGSPALFTHKGYDVQVGVMNDKFGGFGTPELDSIAYTLSHKYLCWIEVQARVNLRHSFNCADESEQANPQSVGNEYRY